MRQGIGRDAIMPSDGSKGDTSDRLLVGQLRPEPVGALCAGPGGAAEPACLDRRHYGDVHADPARVGHESSAKLVWSAASGPQAMGFSGWHGRRPGRSARGRRNPLVQAGPEDFRCVDGLRNA